MVHCKCASRVISAAMHRLCAACASFARSAGLTAYRVTSTRQLKLNKSFLRAGHADVQRVVGEEVEVGRTSTFELTCKKSAAPLHMKPRALPRGNPRLPATARTSRRIATHALHTRAQPSSCALRPSMLRARNFLAQPSHVQPARGAMVQPAHSSHRRMSLG